MGAQEARRVDIVQCRASSFHLTSDVATKGNEGHESNEGSKGYKGCKVHDSNGRVQISSRIDWLEDEGCEGSNGSYDGRGGGRVEEKRFVQDCTCAQFEA